MRITSVSYSRLVNLGNYENERLEVTAAVDEGQDADEVLANLKQYVVERVADVEAERDKHRRREELQYSIKDYEIRLEQAKQQWGKAEAFLKSHNVDVSAYGDLPF